MKFENISQYETKFVVALLLAGVLGFLLGVIKSIDFIVANGYLGQGMYYLAVYWFTSIINKYLFIALVVGLFVLVVLVVVQGFLNFSGIGRKHSNLIIDGIIPALLLFIVAGYWINKQYLPGFYELKSIVGNALWLLTSMFVGWLILKISRTKFSTYLKIENLKILVVIFCLVIGLNLGRYLYFQSLDRDRPSVILISIDTLRADHLSCYGYSRNTSPNIDRFAQDGVLFTNTIAQSSWTLPSHMSMLTGLYPSGHGVLSTDNKLSEGQSTLGELLQNVGYETAAITDGGNVNHRFGYQGFDFFDDKPVQTWGSIEVTYTKAVNWSRKNNSKPFFLFLHTYQVHAPYSPSPQYDVYSDKNYRGMLEETEKKVATDYHSIKDKMKQEDYVYLIDKYDGDIYYTDHFLGKLFQELRDLGLYDSSIIILTSDHGENFLDHKAYKIGHLELYDEVIKVPLIIKAPAFPQNRIVEAQVESIDIMPTVLELLGLPVPAGIDGDSLVEVAKKGSYDSAFAFSEKDYEYKMIRSKDWKLLHRSRSHLELYDLISDPSEQFNLFDEKPEIGKSLFVELQAWMDAQAEKSKVISADKIKIDDELTEQLKALGYVN
jgi:arylsulfatase A-like enzyme